MANTLNKVIVATLVTAAIGVATLASPRTAIGGERRQEECLFNDDCAAPLVCAAGMCRVQCRSDRDCSAGLTCAIDASFRNNRCVPIPPPSRMPPTGFIAGRVETSDGQPVKSCTVELVYATPGRASCDAKGEFIIGDLQAGRYEVRVRAAQNNLSPRAITAWVDPGIHTQVGPITLTANVLADNGNSLTAPAPPLNALKSSALPKR
jgi:hypothetical protein